MTKHALSTVLLLSLAGCAMSGEDPEATPSGVAITMSTADAAQIVAFVNYPGTTLDTLDRLVQLDTRAAHNIIAWRNGVDGVAPSADDDLFPDLASVDAIPYVGDVAFQKLQAYSAAHPAPAPESVEGVAFAGWESESVVWGVNHVDYSVLNGVLDSRAAQALFNHRPYANVTAMGPQSYVGTAALNALRGQAGTWWSAMHGTTPPPPPPATTLAGTFDGVSFDDASARTAIDIANQATRDDLVAHGLPATGAAPIVGNRPYTTLAQVSAVSGVGPATMTALKAYAQSGTWNTTPPPPPPPPAGSFVLDASTTPGIVMLLKENLWEDEGFADTVTGLAHGDIPLATRIMNALEGEIDRAAATLQGTSYDSQDSAADAIYSLANVKVLTRTQGWTYLATLGVTP